MTDENKCLWECPTCYSPFGKHGIAGLINKLEIYLQGKPSTLMGCSIDDMKKAQHVLTELKTLHNKYVRKPNRMMEAQNAITEE